MLPGSRNGGCLGVLSLQGDLALSKASCDRQGVQGHTPPCPWHQTLVLMAESPRKCLSPGPAQSNKQAGGDLGGYTRVLRELRSLGGPESEADSVSPAPLGTGRSPLPWPACCPPGQWLPAMLRPEPQDLVHSRCLWMNEGTRHE